MEVKVIPEESYGNIRYYAQNETASKLLDFLGRKSFTRHQMQILKDIGFKIEVDAPPKKPKIYDI